MDAVLSICTLYVMFQQCLVLYRVDVISCEDRSIVLRLSFLLKRTILPAVRLHETVRTRSIRHCFPITNDARVKAGSISILIAYYFHSIYMPSVELGDVSSDILPFFTASNISLDYSRSRK